MTGLRRATAVVVVALAAVTAACSGGGGDDGDVATLTGDDRDGGEETTSTTVDPEEAMLAFAACMRENGVDFPDPGADGRHEISIDRANEDEWREAEEACEELRPQMDPPSEEEVAEVREQLLAMAECLRDRGYDVPDPEISTPGDGGVMVRQPEPSGFDPDDPDFRAAEEECREELGMEDAPILRGGGAASPARGGGG